MDMQSNPTASSAVKRTLQADMGIEVVGLCVARLLVRVSLGSAHESEPVFVEVVDRGEHKNSDRYLCWAFSCYGHPLQCSVPSASVEAALDHFAWGEIRTKLRVGMYR